MPKRSIALFLLLGLTLNLWVGNSLASGAGVNVSIEVSYNTTFPFTFDAVSIGPNQGELVSTLSGMTAKQWRYNKDRIRATNPGLEVIAKELVPGMNEHFFVPKGSVQTILMFVDSTGQATDRYPFDITSGIAASVFVDGESVRLEME